MTVDPATAEIRQLGLKLECANGFANSRAALAWQDPANHSELALANEQKEFCRDSFRKALEDQTGLDPDHIARLLSL